MKNQKSSSAISFIKHFQVRLVIRALRATYKLRRPWASTMAAFIITAGAVYPLRVTWAATWPVPESIAGWVEAVGWETAAVNLKTAIDSYVTNPTEANAQTLAQAEATYKAAVINARNNPQGSALLSVITDTVNDGGGTGPGLSVLGVPFTPQAALIEVSNGSTLTIQNYDNLGNGGAIRVGSGALLDISADSGSTVLFSSNVTNNSGGAISNDGTVSLSHVILSGNSALEGRGGAIFNQGTMNLSNTTLSGNSALSSGGAILNQETMNLSNTTLSGNSAHFGGAIYNTHILNLTDVMLIGNSAELGGAIYNDSGTLNLVVTEGKTSVFSGNLANNQASSIMFNPAGVLSNFTVNTISSNSTLAMLDPMGVNFNFDGIQINKTGEGIWRLGGDNQFAPIGGGTANTLFSIKDGVFYLYAEGEVANPNSLNANAMVEAGMLSLVGVNSSFTLGSSATLVAGGNNAITVPDGSLTFEAGSTLRGGTASDRSDGASNIQSSLTFDNTTLAGNIQVSAVALGDLFTLNGVFNGPGGLTKVGAGTVVLPKSHAYTGSTFVNAGTLMVNGQVAGLVQVMNGGRLAGTGTVGTTTVDGRIAPGNSIGTLIINGNYVQNPGSIYEVEINPQGSSDLLYITGTASINGGTVEVSKAPGTYVAGTRYTILTAEDGRSGEYEALTQNLPYLNFLLTYDSQHVFLDIARSGINFAALASTPNQRAVANGAESLGAGNPVYDAIANLPDANEARFAFDQLSGEAQVSTLSVLVEESRYVRDAVFNRLQQAFFRSCQPFLDKFGKKTCVEEHSRTALWTQGFGSWGNLDGNWNTARLDRSTGGVFIGADTQVGDRLRVGLLGGYSNSDFEVNARRSNANSDNYTFALYSALKTDRFNLRAGGAYTWYNLDLNRQVSFPGFANALRSSYEANTAQAFAELGYGLTWQRLALEPFVGLAYVNVGSNRLREWGGPAALTARGSNDVFYSTLGAREAAVLYQTERLTVNENILLGWRHAYRGVNPRATLDFASGSLPFVISGAPIARDSLLIDAGVDWNNPAKTLNFRLSYRGEVANDVEDHGLMGMLIWRFD